MKMLKKWIAFLATFLMIFGNFGALPVANAANSGYVSPGAGEWSTLSGLGLGSSYLVKNNVSADSIVSTVQGDDTFYYGSNPHTGRTYDFMGKPKITAVVVRAGGPGQVHYLYRNIDSDPEWELIGTSPEGGTQSFYVTVTYNGNGYPTITATAQQGSQRISHVFYSCDYVPVQYGNIRVRKQFTETASASDTAENFTVRIYGGPNNSVDRTVTVPGTGNWVTVDNLPYGDYSADEILSTGQAANYQKFAIRNSETNSYTFPVDSTNHNGDVTVMNQQLGSITIKKDLTPSDTTSSFTFNITGPSFPSGGENFTLKHGQSKTFSSLVFGTYTVTEQAQAGYRLVNFTGDGATSGNSRSVTLSNNNRAMSFTANNEKRGSITILKTDTVTHGPVSGVTFHVKGPGIDDNYITNASGRIDITDLNAGTYTVTETAVPAGYRINNPDPVQKTIDTGGTAVFNFSDDPIGKFNLIKQDMAGNPLPGAVFWVSKDPNFATYTIYNTAANSSILTDWMIASGTYYVKEVKAPVGYVIPAEDTKQVTLKQGEVTPVIFNDPKDEGSLLIRKRSSYQNQPVEGATFQLSRNAGFTDLVTLPNSGKTNASGELLVEHLASGQYWVREISAAPNYDIDVNVVRNVTVSFNTTANADFVNHPQGRVRIVKTDAFSSAPLAGAVFGVYSDPECNTLVATLAATNDSGIAMSGWLPFSTGTVYYVKEISAPARYIKDNSVKQAVFTTPGQTVELSFENARNFGGFSIRKELTSFTGDTQSFSFTITGPSYPDGYQFSLANGQTKNFPDLIFGNYTITETVALPYELTGFDGGNGTRNGNSYTVALGSENQGFTVTAANLRLGSLSITKALQEGVTGDTADFNFSIAGPGGFADTFTLKAGETKPYANLPYGDYTITELPAPAGYRLDGFTGGSGNGTGNSYTVTLGAANLDIQVTAHNVKLGRLEVVKTESGSEPTIYLAGAVFGIYRDAAATDLVETMTATGADGHAVSGWLDPGTYYVKEITAPDGYVLNTLVVEATVTAGSTALLPAFGNTKNEGSIRVTKLDRQTGDPVEGVTFQLLDRDPRTNTDFTVLQELVTGSNGVVEFLHLTPGVTYYVRETQQAPGYSIDITDVREVTVVLATAVGVEFQNDQVGDFRIVKTDGHGHYLAGAEFLVSRSPDDFSGAIKLVTEADGTVTSDLITVGTWYVKETKAPYGYAIDDASVKEAHVVQFETAEVAFTDTQLLGSVRFSKIVDNVTNDPAVFTLNITGPSGYSDSVTVGELIAPVTLNLPFGTYHVTEMSAWGYSLTGITNDTFTINETSYTSLIEVTATNHKLLGSASFAKVVDNVTDDPTMFTLSITGDNGYGNIVTVSETGTPAVLNDLPFGNYTVAEIPMPGYSTVGITHNTFTVNEESYTARVEVIATNHKQLGTVTFSKIVDNVDSDPATFDLLVMGPDGNRTVTVGENLPPVTLTDLPIGAYTVIEMFKDEYDLVNLTNNFFIITAENYTTPINVVATNHKLLGSAIFYKDVVNETSDPTEFTLNISGPNGYTNTVTVSEAGTPVTLDNLPFGGYTVTEVAKDGYQNFTVTNSTFQINRATAAVPVTVTVLNIHIKGSAYFAKAVDNVDNDATEFTLNISGPNGYINSVTVSEAGNPAFLGDLPAGTYTVTEVASTGYSTVGITNGTFTIGADNFTTPMLVTANNHKQFGSVLVRKLSRMTEAPVQGVTFELMNLNPNDPAFTSANIIAAALTDAKGEALFEHLDAGKTYWVRETIPAPGYDIDPDNTQAVTVIYQETSVVTFENNPVGYVRITKVDANDETKKLEGAVYGIYRFDMPGQAITNAEENPSELPPPDYTVTTGPDGTGISGYIPFSSNDAFLVIELKAPDGYLLNEEEYYVVQFTEPGEIVDVTFHNEKALGALVIRKVDALNPDKPLAGAEFKLYTEEALTHQVGSAVTSGEDGYVRFENLEPGTYWLKETKAPKDYDLLTIPIPFVVEAGVTEPETIIIKNQYNPPKDIETGMMDWNILIIGGLVLLAGLALVLFARKKRTAHSK